ncbi:MAG: DUF3224 domain-containing protein [Thermomicrobiales bacterium]
MSERVAATFAVTGWDETGRDGPAEGPPIARVAVTKVFRGEVEAESTATLLMCQASDGGAGYVGMERVVGTIGSRRGSFVIQHGATTGEPGESTEPNERVAPGRVVPGSGTGDLRGITGAVSFQHSAEGATFRMDFTLLPAG